MPEKRKIINSFSIKNTFCQLGCWKRCQRGLPEGGDEQTYCDMSRKNCPTIPFDVLKKFWKVKNSDVYTKSKMCWEWLVALGCFFFSCVFSWILKNLRFEAILCLTKSNRLQVPYLLWQWHQITDIRQVTVSTQPFVKKKKKKHIFTLAGCPERHPPTPIIEQKYIYIGSMPCYVCVYMCVCMACL